MRRRLIVAIALVAAASVLLFAIPLALVLRQSYNDAEFFRLQRDAVAATRQIDLDPTLSDAIELPQSSDAVGVYTRDGRLREGDGPIRADRVVDEALTSERATDATVAGRLVAVVPLVVREQVTGAVRVSRDGGAVARRVHRAWLALAGLAGVVVLLAVGAAWLVGRRLAQPLERLAGTARRLGDGDFTVCAPPTGIAEIDGVGASLEATARRIGGMIARERTFSADASHQLRTPLAALRLEIESMQLRADAPPEVPLALAQVDRLQATIETLLAVARGLPGIRGPLDLVAEMADVEDRWRGPLAQAGRRLHIDVPIPPPPAVGSSEIVREILAVLVENAVMHGQGTVSVAVSAQSPSGVAIEVGDEGPGIAPDGPDVFARTGHEGHGIGLALARSLAEAEGAQLTLRGPGSVFALLLPKPTSAPPVEP